MRELWVQAELAGRLWHPAKPPALPRFVALNSTCFNFTARMYLDRACWPDLAACPTVIPISSGPGEDIVAHVTRDITQYYADSAPDYLQPRIGGIEAMWRVLPTMITSYTCREGPEGTWSLAACVAMLLEHNTTCPPLAEESRVHVERRVRPGWTQRRETSLEPGCWLL